MNYHFGVYCAAWITLPDLTPFNAHCPKVFPRGVVLNA